MTDRELMQQALEALDLWVPLACADTIAALRERLAQPQRTHWEGCEEVHPECKKPGCAECGKSGGWALYCVACMEKVQHREWVGLTEADGVQIAIDCGCVDVAWLVFARAIEAKLKEKNT